MNDDECSLLIHSRTKFCEFRNDFLVRPDDFEENEIKKYKKMILQTTTSIEELLNSNECRKIVISDNTHIVCGVTAYMKFFTNYNENLKQCLQDEYGRSIYLFVGVVIKKNSITNDVFFPSNEALARFLGTYLISRWNDCQYDDKSRQSTEEPYSENAIGVDDSSVGGDIQVNDKSTQIKIFPANQADDLIKKILSVAKDAETSVCVNFSYEKDAANSDFLNVTIGNNNCSKVIQRSSASSNSDNKDCEGSDLTHDGAKKNGQNKDFVLYPAQSDNKCNDKSGQFTSASYSKNETDVGDSNRLFTVDQADGNLLKKDASDATANFSCENADIFDFSNDSIDNCSTMRGASSVSSNSYNKDCGGSESLNKNANCSVSEIICKNVFEVYDNDMLDAIDELAK